jgi:hypothetical protein
MWETSVAVVILVRISSHTNIISKYWTIVLIAVHRVYGIRIAARILGGRDVVRVGESEDECLCTILPTARGIPMERSETTKEIYPSLHKPLLTYLFPPSLSYLEAL